MSEGPLLIAAIGAIFTLITYIDPSTRQSDTRWTRRDATRPGKRPGSGMVLFLDELTGSRDRPFVERMLQRLNRWSDSR